MVRAARQGADYFSRRLRHDGRTLGDAYADADREAAAAQPDPDLRSQVLGPRARLEAHAALRHDQPARIRPAGICGHRGPGVRTRAERPRSSPHETGRTAAVARALVQLKGDYAFDKVRQRCDV